MPKAKKWGIFATGRRHLLGSTSFDLLENGPLLLGKYSKEKTAKYWKKIYSAKWSGCKIRPVKA